MDPLIGSALIGGASSILGGALSSLSGNNSQRREYARQKEFAQNQIQWRAADAEKAGIHPLAALGANVTSYTPQSVFGSDFGFSDFGQNLNQFIRSYQSPSERAYERNIERTNNALGITNKQLQNDLLRADIDRTRAEASRIAVESQPGNPKPLPNLTQRETVLSPKNGPVKMGQNLFEWNSTEIPGVFRLLPTSDYAQRFEDKAVLEYAPFADSWRAGGFHGKTLQGMIYSTLHNGWIRSDGDLAIDLMNFLREKKEKRERKSKEIQYERR